MGTGHVGTFCLARTKVSVSQKESRYLAQAILFHKYFGHSMPFLWASQMVNNLTANAGDKKCRFDPWVKKIPWRRAWQPIPVFASKEFHEQRSPVGYSPWGCKESDTTKWITLSKRIVIHLLRHMYHGFSRTFTQSRTETGERGQGTNLKRMT